MQRDINRDWALRLAEARIAVFPCGPDKKPLVKWRTLSSSDPEAVAQWWHQFPNALPSIDLEKCDLVVLDGDRHGGPDGVTALRELLRKQNGFDGRAAPAAFTPRDGIHVYLSENGYDLTNTRGDLPAGIDIRAAGGYVVAPYALLPDGRRYRAAPGTPDLIAAYTAGTIPHVPPGVVDLIKARKARHEESHDEPSGETSDQRGRAYAEQALREIEFALTATRAGERNEQLYKAAFRLATMAARDWLTETEIGVALRRACRANGLIEDDGAPAFQRTLESGIGDGLKIPHENLKDRDRSAQHEERTGNAKDDKESRRQRQRSTGSWDDPDSSILDDRRGELPDLPAAAISSAIVEWIDAAAGGAGVTADHVATPFFGVASGLIGIARRVQATRSWRTPATMWACLIGQSGSGKTPAIDVTKRVLSYIERERKSEIAALQLAHDTRQEAAKAVLKRWKEEVAEAIEAGQPPPPKPEQAADIKPFIAPRLYVNDSTIERLAPLLEARPRGII